MPSPDEDDTESPRGPLEPPPHEKKRKEPAFLVEYFDAREHATYLAPCDSIGECLKVIRQFRNETNAGR
jgi:hypothetical protein